MKYIPNILSSLRLISSIPIIILFQLEFFISSTIFFFAVSFTDYFDGYLARKYSTESDFGAFLDLIADKILVLSVLIWFVYFFSNIYLTVLVTLIVIREVIVTSLRYYLISKSSDLDSIKVNQLGKLKTVFQFISISLLLLSPLYEDNFYNISLAILFFSMVLSYFSLFTYLKRMVIEIIDSRCCKCQIRDNLS